MYQAKKKTVSTQNTVEKSTENQSQNSHLSSPTQKDEPKPIVEEEKGKYVSAFSLKSIGYKKDYQSQQHKKIKKDLEAHEAFSEDQILAAWNAYIPKLKKKGQKFLASVLKNNKPKVEGTTLIVELANDTMKKDLESGQNGLMAFIKRKIRNSEISLQIDVNNELIKRYAFTPQERYEKLKEKNPLIDKLKEKFDLEL